MQHCAIFRNRKTAKGQEPKNTGREPGLKGTRSGRFKPPCLPPPLEQAAQAPETSMRASAKITCYVEMRCTLDESASVATPTDSSRAPHVYTPQAISRHISMA